MPKPLLCVTVQAATTAELRAKRDAVVDADLVELRLDSVSDPDVSGALAGRSTPVIVACHPAWEGGAFRIRVANEDPLVARVWAEERWDVIPGAEPHDDFVGRVRDSIDRIAAAHRGHRVVAVAHGGVIGAAMTIAVESNRGFAFAGADNGSVSHLVVADGRWILRRFNDTSHLHRGFDLPPLDAAPTSGFSA